MRVLAYLALKSIRMNDVNLDRRAFLRLPVEQRRQLLEVQAARPTTYTLDSEALEWLEQNDNSAFEEIRASD
jgi:hypothetical protein